MASEDLDLQWELVSNYVLWYDIMRKICASMCGCENIILKGATNLLI